MTEEEKEENQKLEEERKKREEEERINNINLIQSLKAQEKYIKLIFLKTKRSTKIYKNIFYNIQKEIISNELVKDKIIKIIPYGSVTQCTNNEKSDIEITIITKNYETETVGYIIDLLKAIRDKIEHDQK